jgi:hypothetical protein
MTLELVAGQTSAPQIPHRSIGGARPSISDVRVTVDGDSAQPEIKRRFVGEAPFGFTPIAEQVLGLGLPDVATVRCLNLVGTLFREAPQVEVEVVKTDDGGASLMFTSARTGRELTFVVPDDASVLYFVARGPERFRKAGLVTEDAGVEGLADWVGASRRSFSPLGLTVG